ncbi:hypothetical protein DRN67_03150, partial [Candidatus Micrarchaeota archaeon]
MRRAILFLLLLLPAAHAVSYKSMELEPNRLAVLAAPGGEALAIIYSMNEQSAEAAFISATTLVIDGEPIGTGQIMHVNFENGGLQSIRVGGEPSRDSWVGFPITGNVGNYEGVQTIYSSPPTRRLCRPPFSKLTCIIWPV